VKIGIPKEIKDQEFRVGATPAMVRALVDAGHQVLVQQGAGAKIGFLDAAYTQAGAKLSASPSEIYAAEMVVKVKEPQQSEYSLLHEGQILFCYLHLAPDPQQTAALLERKVVGIAYETVTDERGRLPLLIPMSEIAGRIAIQVGATYLQMNHGGKGILLGGVPGVLPARVGVIGGGVVGTEAARMALGLGAHVTVLDKDLHRLRELDALFGPALDTLFSSRQDLEEIVAASDLLIGAVLIPGKTAPKIVKKSMVQTMQPGSMIVDVAIDQGGCCETSRPTTHSEPTYTVDGVVHYCVTNMPGACALTSTQALTHATFDYVLELANKGWRLALLENPYLRNGLNVCLGNVTNSSIAYDLGYEYLAVEQVL
jgi:alanine dehydrogenase